MGSRPLVIFAVLAFIACGDGGGGPSGPSGGDYSFGGWFGARGSGQGEFWDIYQFTVSPSSGNVLVADWGNRRVEIFDPEGAYLGVIDTSDVPGGAGLDEPWSIDCFGGTVFVGDHTGYLVYSFSESGDYLGQWGEYGYGPGQFEELAWIRVLPEGDVAVIDLITDQVQIHMWAGILSTEWTVPDMNYLDEPYIDAFDVSPSGDLYLLCSDDIVRVYGQAGEHLGDHQFDLEISGIAVGPDGTVFVSMEDENGSQIRYYDEGWSQLGVIDITSEVPDGGSYHAWGLDVGSDGRLYAQCGYGVVDLRIIWFDPE